VSEVRGPGGSSDEVGRPAPETPAGGRRLLVVANRTLGGPELAAAVRQRLAAGVREVVVLVPATHSDLWNAQRFQWGMAGALGTPVPELTDDDPEGERDAHERLNEALERLRRAGVDASGRVGPPDPLEAVSQVLDEVQVDEVLISTLPAGLSRWLGLDLPRRIQRRFKVPVTQVTATAPSVVAP